MTQNEASVTGYEVAKFGSKWGVVFRFNATTSFDERVRYSTKREAVSAASMMNREWAREAAATTEGNRA